MPPFWLLKVILCFAVAGDLFFVREYWAATKGGWLRDVIGLTLMLEAFAFFGTIALLAIASFISLTTFTATVLDWIEYVFLSCCGLVYWWRTWVFHQERQPQVRWNRWVTVLAGKAAGLYARQRGRKRGDPPAGPVPADEPGSGGSGPA
jgi:hypothetical protein